MENEYNIKSILILRLVKSLQSSGLQIYNTEQIMTDVSDSLEVDTEFFISPNSIFVSFDKQLPQKNILTKSNDEDWNFEKLQALDTLTRDVIAKEITVEAALKEIDRIETIPNRYSKLTTIFSFGLSSGSAAVLFGGGYRESIVAAIIGFLVGFLLVSGSQLKSVMYIITFISAFLAIIIAKLGLLTLGPFSEQIAVITGIVVLIPGFSLTIGMTELARGHAISGNARLSKTIITFLMLVLGMTMGAEILQLLQVNPISGPSEKLPLWTEFIALIFIPYGFVVLFRAHLSTFKWMFLSILISFLFYKYGPLFFDPKIVLFLASIILVIFCNLISRKIKLINSIMLVPAVMVLVPGSVGLKSLNTIINNEALFGIENAFETIFLTIALVAGIIIGNAIVPPRKLKSK